jgi:hypothetical protein
VNIQAELDRAFGAAAALLGDVITWQRGDSLLSVSAFINSGTEPEAATLGSTVTAVVRLLDFPGSEPTDLIGDLVTIGANTYSAYRVEAYPDGSAKCWLKRRQ